ncbi:hypothetical protein AVEN_100247-1 [Araneus ventricosus]|uniref:Uncharacterized protein n=1 Tax=Araneus ventricosus TaxID=182803 RepID=A0A4Y2LHA1_ARAVE|nr:hypothetical protein AVEN_100247-1 [Araneus ventricosus]
MTVTALSIALSSPAFRLAQQTKLQSRYSRSTHTTQYRSASNSLLSRVADETPRRDSHSKGHPSRSTRSSLSIFTRSVIQASSLYSLIRQAMVSHGIIGENLDLGI